ncbi:MAG: hypothetical protein WD850_00700 [Candidatus Spechtbacterales bacterium]
MIRMLTTPLFSKTFFSRKKIVIIGLFGIANVLLFVLWLAMGAVPGEVRDARSSEELPEIQELQDTNRNFGELSGYFSALAENKGGGYAFAVLRAVELPPNIDTHLLGHVVGDILYKQKGLEGINVCTHDFRNACSHSIVVGLFNEFGEGALDDIAAACRQAPGGKGAYTMCFHGLGHGVLAFVEYEMPDAIALCEKTGTALYQNREYIECVGGTVMEMMAGVHDPELWREKSKKYFRQDDPLYPCTSDFMPDEARETCYMYLTPHLLEYVGGNPEHFTTANFRDAFALCDKADQRRLQLACKASFGKEFIGLIKNRDIRDVANLSEEEARTMYEWCLLAGDRAGSAACIDSAMASLYWGGENDRSGAVRFCGVVDDGEFQTICFNNLIGAVQYYVHDRAYYESFCSELPSAYTSACKERLLQN